MTQPVSSITAKRLLDVFLGRNWLADGARFEVRTEGDGEDWRLNIYKAGTAPAAAASAAPTLGAEPAPIEGPELPADPPKLKGGRISTRAAIVCAEGAFQLFLGVEGKEAAAEAVRSRCGILSRAELDHSEAAATTFHALVRDYEAWLRDE